MIEITNYEVVGWEHAIRGMRNPLNSWDKSDSEKCLKVDCDECKFNSLDDCSLIDHVIGPNDLTLMKKLATAGSSHRKYLRMIPVYVDIVAPLYWWKEFDTYKVGTVANSCSTMHKIHAKEFTLDDFSHEHLDGQFVCASSVVDNFASWDILCLTINGLNYYRQKYLETKDKNYWWQMIQLLPSSYNQKRTVMLNYEVLANMYHDRKNHKLDEWHDLCAWIEELPYSELITGGEDGVDE